MGNDAKKGDGDFCSNYEDRSAALNNTVATAAITTPYCITETTTIELGSGLKFERT